MWLARQGRDRPSTDPALESLKFLAGMNPRDRQNRQQGLFGIEYRVLKQSVFDKIQREKKEFKDKRARELTKKLAAEPMGLNELDRRIDKEVERQTREKFASPVGPWTPINQTHPPKMPSIGAH